MINHQYGFWYDWWVIYLIILCPKRFASNHSASWPIPYILYTYFLRLRSLQIITQTAAIDIASGSHEWVGYLTIKTIWLLIENSNGWLYTWNQPLTIAVDPCSDTMTCLDELIAGVAGSLGRIGQPAHQPANGNHAPSNNHFACKRSLLLGMKLNVKVV